MPTTRAVARRLIAETLGGGAFTVLTTTSAGALGGTTVVSTNIAEYGDDRFNDWWCVLPNGPGGSGSYEARLVTDFVSSSGSLTIRTASAQVGNSVTFELHRYNPLITHLALIEGIKSCFGDNVLFRERLDETLVVDNMLLNSDFETFSAGNFTNWTLTGVGASVAQSTTIRWHGSDAAFVTAGATASAIYNQSVTSSPGDANIFDPRNMLWKFGAWVYATSADTARIQITDGVDTESSEYHTGQMGWEYLEVTLMPGSTITSVACRFQVAANGSARIDAAFCTVSPLARLAIPSTIQRGPTSVLIQADRNKQNAPYVPWNGWHVEGENETRYLVFDAHPPSGHRLRLVGRSALTEPTADTTEMEIDEPQNRLLILKSAAVLMRMMAQEAPSGQRQDYIARSNELQEEYLGLVRSGHMRMYQPVQVQMARW